MNTRWLVNDSFWTSRSDFGRDEPAAHVIFHFG
jgi:hypothetical protein